MNGREEVMVEQRPFERRGAAGTSDRVFGFGLAFDARIGYHRHELDIRQRIEIDFEAETDWREAARRDRPVHLVNYHDANRLIGELVASRRWRLVEALAEDVARLLCDRFPVSGVRVRVTKRPFDMPNVRAVAVACWRTPDDFREPATAPAPARDDEG